MGVDAVILFRSNVDSPDLDCSLPPGFEIRKLDVDWYACGQATHRVETGCRFYGPGYERGPWGQICTVLMMLHASPDVQQVFYGGDSDTEIYEFTIQDVLNTSRHYMLNGERPYRLGAPQIE